MNEMNQNKIKILIAEDEIIINLALSKTLINFGYKVIAVDSPEELLKTFYNERPDLLITDIQFNGKLTGLETALIINKNLPTPIIFISGYINDEHRKLASPINVCEFVNKPFDDDELEVKIKECLDRFNLMYS